MVYTAGGQHSTKQIFKTLKRPQAFSSLTLDQLLIHSLVSTPFRRIPMDPNNPSPQSGNVMRRLPAYEETNIPYSFRLPTYRSSYIRRFHPYARYVSLSIKEYDMVCAFFMITRHVLTSKQDEDEFGGDEAPLDLHILGERALQHDTTPTAPVIECVDE